MPDLLAAATKWYDLVRYHNGAVQISGLFLILIGLMLFIAWTSRDDS